MQAAFSLASEYRPRAARSGVMTRALVAAERSTRSAACSRQAYIRTSLKPESGNPAMANAKSTKVPKGWEGFYAALTGMTDRFCAERLDGEYAELTRYAIAALCRKRPSPLASGNPQTWACAVLYALGQVNFLSDKSSRPHMAMADLCARFGIVPSTGGNKAKTVRDALGIRQFDHRWALPSLVAGNEMFWLVEVDGFPVDARRMPRDVQEQAARRGLIPYVWSGNLAAEG